MSSSPDPKRKPGPRHLEKEKKNGGKSLITSVPVHRRNQLTKGVQKKIGYLLSIKTSASLNREERENNGLFPFRRLSLENRGRKKG